MSAIWVESGEGIPTCRRTASPGEPDRQHGDDDKGQREGTAGEPAAVIWPELAELGDGGGRRFGTGG
jgi:hypothetical protein